MDEFTGSTIQVCQECSDEEWEIDGWEITLAIHEVDEFSLDNPAELVFCSTECFRNWVENEPAPIYDSE